VPSNSREIVCRHRTERSRAGASGWLRRYGAVGSLFLAALLTVLGVTLWRNWSWLGLAAERYPQLIIEDSVASDLAALAGDTWTQFLDVLEGRTGCFGDVRLRASRNLGDRAAYNPDTATVTVRVPGSRALLQSALIHEWAHHVEFQCQEHEELRAAFMAAQGLPPDVPWRPDLAPADIPASEWAEIPSEQYAEAMIVLVLGRRQTPTLASVKAEAVRVLAEWAEGANP
jgi:hypothetical protein